MIADKLTKHVLADWISINEICKVTQKVLLELSPIGYLPNLATFRVLNKRTCYHGYCTS